MQEDLRNDIFFNNTKQYWLTDSHSDISQYVSFLMDSHSKHDMFDGHSSIIMPKKKKTVCLKWSECL